jgi:hypothetical protein
MTEFHDLLAPFEEKLEQKGLFARARAALGIGN